jgi:hypothetical protein
MSPIKPKLTHLNKSDSEDNPSSEYFYTPCTSGAFGEQLEFDFGPEFSNPASELCSETNSTLEQPSSPCERGGFIGIKEDTE